MNHPSSSDAKSSEPTSTRRFELVIFDLDGTLITLDKSVWQLLHDSLGTDPAARQATLKKAKSGEITYDEWFHTDLIMLREAGARREDVQRVLGGLEVVEGARELLAELRAAGCRIAVISVTRPRHAALARGPRGRTRLVVTNMTQLFYVFLAVLFSPRG